jgi:hypothetical protein
MVDDSQIETPAETTPEAQEPLGPQGIRAVQGEGVSTGEWVDHGIMDVPVQDLPTPDGVSSPADFNHHISWEDARAATEQLPGLQEQVNAGATGDDFSAADDAAGLSYAEGQRRLYDLYYGSDPVYVNKIGDNYDIISGRHRIYAAQALGMESIPVRVKEKMI